MQDVKISCLNCPSFLSPEKSVEFFQKSIGAPVCARFGKPIGHRKSTVEQRKVIGEFYASRCDQYGKPCPPIPNWKDVKFEVALPDMVARNGSPVDPDVVKSCSMCENFIREDVVYQNDGVAFSAGMCAAFGKLLLANRYSEEAKGCEYRSRGTARNHMTGITFIREYTPDFLGDNDPVLILKRTRGEFIPPEDFKTDAPVSSGDEEDGIRGWRKITDPKTGIEIFIPVFTDTIFTPERRAMIPRTGDREHPEDYVDHMQLTYKVGVLWHELEETPALWGISGTGKTEFFRYMAWLMNLPYHHFPINYSSELDDLEGKLLFINQQTDFQLGRFSSEWTEPGVLGVDEWNTGKEDVQQFFRPLTENSRRLILDQWDGRHLAQGEFTYLGMSMNPPWDMRNIGAHEISDADSRRLNHIRVDLPPEEVEKEIILRRVQSLDGYVIHPDRIDFVMKCAEDIRGLSENGTIPISWAIGPQIKVARLLKYFEPIQAYGIAAANFLEPQAAERLLDAVKTHVE